MALVVKDRVRETTTTTGTGTITLAGAVAGFQSFSVIGNGNTTYYAIVDATTGAWEVGIGTYTSSGTTLSRTTVLESSNAGSLVNFAAGTKDVFCTYPAEVSVDQSDIGTAPNQIPLNQYLGSMAYEDNDSVNITGGVATLSSANIGTLTNSGGTANGVLYLNGSKAVTSGSALTFDGTNNLTVPKEIYQTTATDYIRIAGGNASATGANIIVFGQSHSSAPGRLAFTAVGTGEIQFNQGGAERMRLTSTGLGIGTSSPVSKLQSLSAVSALTSNSGFSSFPLTVSDSTALAADTGGGINFSAIITAAGEYNSIAAIKAGRTVSTTSDYRGYLSFYTGANSVGYPLERMRIDASGNLGLGVTPSAWGSGYKAFQVGDSALSNFGNGYAFLSQNVLFGTSTTTYINSAAASYYRQYLGSHAWFTAPSGTAGNAISFTQAMTLDASGRLLLGTTTANELVNFVSPNAASYIQLANSGTGSTSADGFFIGSFNATAEIRNKENAPLTFGTNNTERMRIDSSGNLGLGVTPSAWGYGGNIQLIGSGALTFSGIGGNLGTNCYFSSGWKYISTNVAALYAQTSGQHQWFTAPSGTAGNAISFTQAMTLDASGNLLVGTTSPGSHRLKVVGAGGNLAGNAYYVGLIGDGSASNKGVGIGYDSSGQVGIIYSETSSSPSNLAFWTYSGSGWGERMRIDSSGNLLVGTTTVGGKVAVVQGESNYQLNMLSTGDTPFGIISQYNATPNGTGNEFLLFRDTASGSAVQRMGVRSNGGIANYQGNDVNLSDAREKTDFAPAKSYLDTICAIPVQTFKYIDQTDEEKTLGVVAQDVQAVAPELVMESNWGTEEDPKMRLSIYQTDLQYALMKCIQEQQALIESLTARVAQLEGN